MTIGFFQCLIDTIVDNNFQIHLISSNVLMECKKGFVHNFAWFEIQSKKMCINCGLEEQDLG
jgi:hypothetical protein